MVLSMVAQYKWTLNQSDVTGAYLLAPPSRTYYLRYPVGYDNTSA